MLHALALAAALTAAGPSPEHTAQALLDAMHQQSGVPGMAAAVWQGGALVWQGQAGRRGTRDAQPLRADDRFPLASVSKLVTATLAARHAAAGRLDLDAPVPGRAYTPRQLAAHSSGLPHYELPRDALRGRRTHASVEAALRDAVGERRLQAAPGAAYLYSSWGYTALSHVVEQAGGQPFLQQAQAEGGFGTQADTEVEAGHDYSYSWGGAGLAASAGQLARWGGRLLGEPALLAELARPSRLSDGREIDTGGYRVGLGWRVQPALDGSGPLMHHAGSRPDARTALALWPGSGTASALLANGEWRAFVVPSAELLAAPFRERPAALTPRACPVQATRLRFEVDAAAEDLPLGPVSLRDGLCRSTLPPGPLGAVLRESGAPAGAALALIGLDGQGGWARAALVTPVGLIELRAQADGSLAGRYGQRRLRLSVAEALQPPAPASGAGSTRCASGTSAPCPPR